MLYRAILILVPLALLLRGVFIVEPPGRDQSLFLTQASHLLDGLVLYRDIWEHKPPGIILLYTVALSVFGHSYMAVQILTLIWGILSALGIWLLTLRFLGRPLPGLIAGSLYLLYYCGLPFGGFWATAQAEVFMDLLVIAAIYQLTSPAPTYRHVFGAGACLCLAVLLKYSALPLLLLGVPVLCRTGLGLPRSRMLVAFVLGISAPVLLLLGYLLATGAGEAFWFATIIFNLDHRQVSNLPRFNLLGAKLLYRFQWLAPLYTLALAGLLYRLSITVWSRWRRPAREPRRRDKRRRRRHPGSDAPTVHPRLIYGTLAMWGLGLWCLAIIQVFWQAKFWVYHYHIILLPLCMLAAVGADWIIRLLRGSRLHRIGGLLAAIVLLVSMYAPFKAFSAYEKSHALMDYWRSRVSTDQFLGSYRWGGGDYDYAENKRVASRVAAETSPDDSIFVWGFEPGIYFLSDRGSASRFLYDYPLMIRFGSVHKRFMDELLSDLGMRPPERFLIYVNDANAIEPESSWDQIQGHARLREYVTSNYEFLWRIGDALCYAPKP